MFPKEDHILFQHWRIVFLFGSDSFLFRAVRWRSIQKYWHCVFWHCTPASKQWVIMTCGAFLQESSQTDVLPSLTGALRLSSHGRSIQLLHGCLGPKLRSSWLALYTLSHLLSPIFPSNLKIRWSNLAHRMSESEGSEESSWLDTVLF